MGVWVAICPKIENRVIVSVPPPGMVEKYQSNENHTQTLLWNVYQHTKMPPL